MADVADVDCEDYHRHGRAGISPEMAVRLSIAFDTTAESWLNQQVQYDLWLAEKRRKSLKVARIAA
jgi:addiction module HigA family antidote